jgi:hypothetical protein
VNRYAILLGKNPPPPPPEPERPIYEHGEYRGELWAYSLAYNEPLYMKTSKIDKHRVGVILDGQDKSGLMRAEIGGCYIYIEKNDIQIRSRK